MGLGPAPTAGQLLAIINDVWCLYCGRQRGALGGLFFPSGTLDDGAGHRYHAAVGFENDLNPRVCRLCCGQWEAFDCGSP